MVWGSKVVMQYMFDTDYGGVAAMTSRRKCRSILQIGRPLGVKQKLVESHLDRKRRHFGESVS